ncbi:MAG TPA: dethiobiotin synthase [Solirubrobacteraceae bacterium]|nr:dethiobiotin synthase [Solirubrobacteraceae bacterium]
MTGTDTGVGKSVVSAALLAAMRASGETVRAHKPVLTGLDDEAPQSTWPPDHVLLGAAAGMSPSDVAPLRLGPASSPHLAAQLTGVDVDPSALLDAACAGPSDDVLVVEGVGGLLVPLAEDYLVLDLARELGLPLVIAARPGLGTINHSLLSVRAARAAGLAIAAVVLTPWPRQPSALERSNRDTIARLGEVDVAVLPLLPGSEIAGLARAGAGLAWRRWLER